MCYCIYPLTFALTFVLLRLLRMTLYTTLLYYFLILFVLSCYPSISHVCIFPIAFCFSYCSPCWCVRAYVVIQPIHSTVCFQMLNPRNHRQSFSLSPFTTVRQVLLCRSSRLSLFIIFVSDCTYTGCSCLTTYVGHNLSSKPLSPFLSLSFIIITHTIHTIK